MGKVAAQIADVDDIFYASGMGCGSAWTFSWTTRKYFTYTNEKSGSDAWPFDKDHYLILNWQLAGPGEGRRGIDDTIFPQRYLIDYVRVYQKESKERLWQCVLIYRVNRCGDLIGDLASLLQQPHAVGVSETGQSFDYDVAIIGGGSGGYAGARTAANAGLRTVVIEGGKEVGGLCILRGCMPTKALLYAAEVMHLASHAEPWAFARRMFRSISSR